MRNLKKILALVLALVMSLSLVTMANADFSDAADIDNKEAVDVMAAIGVLEGSDGKFDPDGILTREQAAKIITYMLLGNEKADKLTTIIAPFSDVAADRWSAGAIAYCADQGILDGIGGNKFDPTGKLTGLQFAKMLLCALGYDATIEGLTGESFAIKSATLAVDLGLDAGIDANLSAQMTRQDAAQMAFNTLKTGLVKYGSKGTNIKLPDGTSVVVGADPAETYANTTALPDTLGDGTVAQFAEKYFKDLDLKTDAGNDADNFGRPAHSWYVGTEKVGTYADAVDYTVLVKGTDNDTLAKIVDDLDLDINGKTGSYAKGDSVELFVDDDKVVDEIGFATRLGKITKVVKTTDKDADYTYTVTIKTTGVKAYKDTQLVGFDAETMVEDAYVTVTVSDQSANYAVVALAEPTTGKMTAKGDGYIKVDGEKVELSGRYAQIDAMNYSDTFDFYTDANGYLLAAVVAEEAEEETNVLYVEDADFVAGDKFTAQVAKIAVVYLDGTEAVLDVNVNSDDEVKLNGSDVSMADDLLDSDDAGFYEYTLTSDGKVKSLTKLSSGSEYGVDQAVVITEKTATVKVNNVNKLATTKTTLTVIDDGESKTITGYKNFENESYTVSGDVYGILVVYNEDDATAVEAIYVLGGNLTVTEDAIVGWLVEVGDEYEVDGTTYDDVVYNVDGENKTYKVEDVNGASADSFPTFATITVTDGVASLSGTVANSVADSAVTKVTDTYILTHVDNNVHYLADDVVYYDVTNVADNGVLTTDGVSAGDVITYVTNDDSEIAKVYITYAAQEDGCFTAAPAAYLRYLGYNQANADFHAALGERGVTIQFTVSEDATAVQLVVYDANGDEYYDTGDMAVSWAAGSTKALMVNLDDTDPAVLGGQGFAAGEYTYEVVCNGTVVATGAFEA